MKISRPHLISPELAAAALTAGAHERALAVRVRVRPGAANGVVAGRYVRALNDRAGENVLAEDAGALTGYVSPAELAQLSAEIWVTDLTLIA